jgi:beta-1,4-mannosyl-glycoprotein beta-1,4-N-acetylglucosaminyltransferase
MTPESIAPSLAPTRPRVYDCFTYDGEDCLDLRLRAHWEQVDVFVIVEAALTFAGQPKALSFDAERHAWAMAKIRYVPLEAQAFAGCATAWDRERTQRNALRLGYADAAPDDVVLIGDVDEILREDQLRPVAPGEIHVFEQLMLYFYCDYLMVSEPFWRKAVAVSGATALQHDAEDLRNGKALRARLREVSVKDAGWHFSYLGGMDMVQKKLERFSHQNLNKPRYRDARKNLARLYAGKDIYHRAKRWGRVQMPPEGHWGSSVVERWFQERPELWAPHDIRSAGRLDEVLERHRSQPRWRRRWSKLWLRLWNLF